MSVCQDDLEDGIVVVGYANYWRGKNVFFFCIEESSLHRFFQVWLCSIFCIYLFLVVVFSILGCCSILYLHLYYLFCFVFFYEQKNSRWHISIYTLSKYSCHWMAKTVKQSAYCWFFFFLDFQQRKLRFGESKKCSCRYRKKTVAFIKSGPLLCHNGNEIWSLLWDDICDCKICYIILIKMKAILKECLICWLR